jgi:CheY-like chemotaxis protein
MKTNPPKKCRILVVDDNPRIRRIVVKTLSADSSYVVTEATDGNDALDKIESGCDLLLLDMMMPELDGKNAFKTLQNKRASGGQVPLTILMTGLPVEDPRVDAIVDDYQIAGCLQKPFTADELKSLVSFVLQDQD